MTYPVHPNKEPPFPQVWPCPWCGRENPADGHDLMKHIDPSVGTPLTEAERMAIRLRKFLAEDDRCSDTPKADV